MNQVKIRHPMEGDELGIDAIFTEIEGTLDKDAKDAHATWLKGQRQAIFDAKYEGPFKALVAVKDEGIVGLVRFPHWKDITGLPMRCHIE